MNGLESNHRFSHRNVFQNGVNTLSKMVNHFLSKSSKFCVEFGPYDFVQILPACGRNTYQRMYGETLDFQHLSNVSISNGNIKYPIGKSIFAVNLPSKLSPATVANVDVGSLKSLHTLFDKYLNHILVKFE